MKKVKLKALEAGAKELLSREQLKNVFGGCTSGLCFADACFVNGFSGHCAGTPMDSRGNSSCNCGGREEQAGTSDPCNAYNEI